MNLPDARRGWLARHGGWWALLLITLTLVAVGWPGLDGDWGRDDYFQLALARMIGSPWPLFGSDHYPVPGSVFRPLGFASMWLDTWLFGGAYRGHAACDLALHVGVALALFGLLRRAGVDRPAAVLATLVFALHPVALGPAQWWSARFDVLAAACILGALQAGLAWCARPRGTSLLLALLAAFAAMASKEIGLIAPALLVLLWLHCAWREPAQRVRALWAAAAAGLCAALFLLWRWRVLGTVGSGLLGGRALVDALAGGIGVWLHEAPGYFSFAARLASWQRVLLALALFGLAATCGLLAWRRRGSPTAIGRAVPAARFALLCCGLGLLLLPAVLQAPVAMLNGAPLRADDSAVEAAMQSRLYYLGMVGLAVLLGALLAACRGRLRHLAGAATLLALVALGSAGQRAVREFAQRSVDNARSAHAAVAAVAALPLVTTPCRIVFVGAPQPAEWGGFVSMDGIVKALAADRAAIARCWIFEDGRPTWFHLQDATARPADALPWTPLVVDGQVVPWPRVGDLRYAYLSPPPRFDLRTLVGTHFLRWRDGRFEDIGVEVAAGRVQVQPWHAEPTRHN